METDPLLKNVLEVSVQGVQKSHILNLLFGNLVLFILILASHIHSPVQSQYIYKRALEEVFGNSSATKNVHLKGTCHVNTTDPGYLLQEKAQSMAAAKQMQFTILRCSIAIFTIVVLGAYSDSVSRKVLFVWPMSGSFLRYCITAVIIFFNLDLNYFFASEILDGLMGGYYTILLASYTYTADNTPATGSRTIGIALVEFCENVGRAASFTATGFFIQDAGYFYPALTAALLCLVDILLVFFLLPERKTIKHPMKSCCITPQEAFRRVFGFYLIHGTTLNKLCFILAMIVFILTCLPGVVKSNIDTLYKLNPPFCWSPEMIGYYSTAGSVVQQVIGVPLTRLLQCCCIDEVIGVIGTLAVAGAEILQGFAYSDVMMYAVVAVKIPAASLFSVCRSVLSRMAPAHRQGSLFASVAVIETVCTLVGTPILSNIYQKTMVISRGFVFFIMASVHVIAAIFLIMFIFVSKPEREKRLGESLVIEDERLMVDCNDCTNDEK